MSIKCVKPAANKKKTILNCVLCGKDLGSNMHCVCLLLITIWSKEQGNWY